VASASEPAEAAIDPTVAARGPVADARATDAELQDGHQQPAEVRSGAPDAPYEPKLPQPEPPQPPPAGDATPAAPWVPAAGASAAVAVVLPAPEALPAAPAPASPAWRPAPSGELVRAALPWARRALHWAAAAAAGVVVTVLVLVVAYRWVNPPVSTLMLGQSLAGTPIERAWVPIERISPNLIRAVVLSEDAAFCRHDGVDWGAIEEAMEGSRGGSTITMQVVKNLFLWPSRSYVRKAIEIGLAHLVEALLPKRRIMEIYLNIAEWGDGIFGAEAAARAHFDKRASRLTSEEAALLAVALPNPVERTAGSQDLVTARLATRLMARMATSRADFSCLPVPRRVPRKTPPASPTKAPLVQGP
jgi:monofunctional biosynthetic peptidoglycan transglycosylase